MTRAISEVSPGNFTYSFNKWPGKVRYDSIQQWQCKEESTSQTTRDFQWLCLEAYGHYFLSKTDLPSNSI